MLCNLAHQYSDVRKSIRKTNGERIIQEGMRVWVVNTSDDADDIRRGDNGGGGENKKKRKKRDLKKSRVIKTEQQAIENLVAYICSDRSRYQL